MIDLFELICKIYKNKFSDKILNLIKDYNISLLDSNELAIQIYKIQRKIYVNGGVKNI